MSIIINGTTGISGVDGSASTPSLQGNDTNTGIFYPAADTIAFAEGGVEAMRIDSSGNVGIGTTSPDALLTVNTIASFGDGAVGTPSIAHKGDLNTGLWFPAADTIAASTAGTERMRIASNGYVTNAVNGLGNGIVQAQQYYRLNSSVVGADSNTTQSLLGVGVTLVASTQYEFEIVGYQSKSAGTTSHNISYRFGGTCTVNNLFVNLFPATSTTEAGAYIITALDTSVFYTSVSTSATFFCPFVMKGTISVNTGGTFIPQYVLSAAPGGAYSTAIGTYMKIAPLAASGANVSIGSWS